MHPEVKKQNVSLCTKYCSKNVYKDTRGGANVLSRVFTVSGTKHVHMELVEWLVHRAAKLVLRVQCSTRSSSMMHVLHSHKKLSCNCVA